MKSIENCGPRAGAWACGMIVYLLTVLVAGGNAKAEDYSRWQLRTTLEGHTGAVGAVDWYPLDGSLLASGARDRTIRIWDTQTWQLSLPPLTGHTAAVLSVAWSPDESLLASGSDDRTIRLWDTQTWESRTLEGHTDGVSSVCWSPDGSWLASASFDQTIKIWDVASGTELLTLDEHTNWVDVVSWSPDGSLLASGSSDRTIKLWNTETWQARTLRGSTDSVYSITWSPDGSQLASGGGFDRTIRIWDVANGAVSLTLRSSHANGIDSVAWSPDGLALASGGGMTIQIWDLDTQQSVRTLEPVLRAYSLRWFPDGSLLASGSSDGKVRLWGAPVE